MIAKRLLPQLGDFAAGAGCLRVPARSSRLQLRKCSAAAASMAFKVSRNAAAHDHAQIISNPLLIDPADPTPSACALQDPPILNCEATNPSTNFANGPGRHHHDRSSAAQKLITSCDPLGNAIDGYSAPALDLSGGRVRVGSCVCGQAPREVGGHVWRRTLRLPALSLVRHQPNDHCALGITVLSRDWR
jgi:hypothetical protein